MTGREFTSEAEQLARPCVLLRDKGPKDAVAAIWGGSGILPAPVGDYRHWLSIDCRFLPDGVGPEAGCLSVYTDEDDCESGVAVHDPAAQLKRVKGDKPLYAHTARSLPFIDAVFRFGSSAVHLWLRKNGWKPAWGYNDNFKDSGPVKEYLQRYQSESPMYSGGAYAVLGGWHFPWPDGDWAKLVKQSLLVWTFEESEPWVEVWAWGKGFRVMQRIT